MDPSLERMLFTEQEEGRNLISHQESQMMAHKMLVKYTTDGIIFISLDICLWYTINLENLLP